MPCLDTKTNTKIITPDRNPNKKKEKTIDKKINIEKVQFDYILFICFGSILIIFGTITLISTLNYDFFYSFIGGSFVIIGCALIHQVIKVKRRLTLMD